ncbi:MAG: alpha-1,2-fucosyltransferase [Planctomycetaceae bacterium]|nr:alpha-1,2-fucosyltransferase [Planctomycetaceae bacterium]
MIVIKLLGGLGNQMFQYALGRQLSLKLNTELKIDLSEFRTYPLRQYELNFFGINENFIEREELNRLKKKYFKWFSANSYMVVKEKSFLFEPEILSLSGNLMLKGYWQSYRYFDRIPETLRKDFSLKQPFSRPYQLLTEEICNSNSVSVHIRRGDYIQNKITNQYHGVCNLQYYLDAANFIAQKINDPVFYVFSDDHDWLKSNFVIPFKFKLIAGIEKQTSQQDMILMSNCKHHIIANSTFSWWAAWLNPNPQKIVIAPLKWFAGARNKTDDLIPIDWIRL